jgi:hypothetical protein
MASNELIYKDDARRAILKTNPSIAFCIDNIKAVDAIPANHSEWVCVNEDENVWMCAGIEGCGGEMIILEKTPLENGFDFCPYCGADMRGKEDG